MYICLSLLHLLELLLLKPKNTFLLVKAHFPFHLTVRVCSPLISKHPHTQSAWLDCIHHAESITSAARVKNDVITLSKVEVSAGKREEGGGGYFPLTHWQPAGHRVYLSLAAGLSAAPVNLPDSSLQVPLIPLIQFILLTAPMRPRSTGEIKPSLHSELSLCRPRDGNPLSNGEMKGVRQPPWQSDYSPQTCLCFFICCTQGFRLLFTEERLLCRYARLCYTLAFIRTSKPSC